MGQIIENVRDGQPLPCSWPQLTSTGYPRGSFDAYPKAFVRNADLLLSKLAYLTKAHVPSDPERTKVLSHCLLTFVSLEELAKYSGAFFFFSKFTPF